MSCVTLSECVPASVWCPVVLEHFVCGMFWCFIQTNTCEFWGFAAKVAEVLPFGLTRRVTG